MKEFLRHKKGTPQCHSSQKNRWKAPGVGCGKETLLAEGDRNEMPLAHILCPQFSNHPMFWDFTHNSGNNAPTCLNIGPHALGPQETWPGGEQCSPNLEPGTQGRAGGGELLPPGGKYGCGGPSSAKSNWAAVKSHPVRNGSSSSPALLLNSKSGYGIQWQAQYRTN